MSSQELDNYLLGTAHVRTTDDFEQRHAGAIVVNVRERGVHIVQIFTWNVGSNRKTFNGQRMREEINTGEHT